SWAGAACDPETGMLYVPSVSLPIATQVVKSPFPHVDYLGGPGPVETVHGLFIFKPPYARVTAIDLNSGDHRWMVPLGDIPGIRAALRPLNPPPLGRPARGHILLTKTLLIIGQEGITQRAAASPRGFAIVADFVNEDPKLCALDKASGNRVGEVTLPANVTGAPMTYMLNGKQ